MELFGDAPTTTERNHSSGQIFFGKIFISSKYLLCEMCILYISNICYANTICNRSFLRYLFIFIIYLMGKVVVSQNIGQILFVAYPSMLTAS